MESSMTDQIEIDPLDVPLWGCRAIAAVINRPPRATFHLLKAGRLPARKVGDTWVSTPRQLLAVFDAGER